MTGKADIRILKGGFGMGRTARINGDVARGQDLGEWKVI